MRPTLPPRCTRLTFHVVPFVIPFESRVAIFRQSIQNDRKRLGIERHVYDRQRRHKAVIRRNNLSSDAYAALNGLGAALKSTIEIVFVDQHGLEEKGIDGGGLFKELLTRSASLKPTPEPLADAFAPVYQKKHSTRIVDCGSLRKNKNSIRILTPTLESRLSCCGTPFSVEFSAKRSTKGFSSMFDSLDSSCLNGWGSRVIVRASLVSSESALMLSAVDDLSSLDPELFEGMIFLKNYLGNVEADLSLNFTVTDDGQSFPCVTTTLAEHFRNRLWSATNDRPPPEW